MTPEQAYRKGQCDAECATLCGMKPHQFRNWRVKHGLPALRAPGNNVTRKVAYPRWSKQ